MPLDTVEQVITVVEGEGATELTVSGIAKLLLCAQIQISAAEKQVPYATVLTAVGEARILALMARFRLHFSDLDKHCGKDFTLKFTAEEATAVIFTESNQLARPDFLLSDQFLLRKGTHEWLTGPTLLGAASSYTKAVSACIPQLLLGQGRLNNSVNRNNSTTAETLQHVSLATLYNSNHYDGKVLDSYESYLNVEVDVAHSAILPSNAQMSSAAMASASLQTNPNIAVNNAYRVQEASPWNTVRGMSPGWIVANRSARATMKGVTSSPDDRLMMADSILRFIRWLGTSLTTTPTGIPNRQNEVTSRHMVLLCAITTLPALHPAQVQDVTSIPIYHNKLHMEEYWSHVMASTTTTAGGKGIIDRVVFGMACEAALRNREEECWSTARSHPMESTTPTATTTEMLLSGIKSELALMDFLALCIAWEVYFAECRMYQGVDFDSSKAIQDVVRRLGHPVATTPSQLAAACLVPLSYTIKQRQDFLMSSVVEAAMMSPVSCPTTLTERGLKYQRDQVERPYLGMAFGTDMNEEDDKHIMMLPPRALIRYMSRWASQRADAIVSSCGRNHSNNTNSKTSNNTTGENEGHNNAEEEAMRRLVTRASLRQFQTAVGLGICTTSILATETCDPQSIPTLKMALLSTSANKSATPQTPSVVAAQIELEQVAMWVRDVLRPEVQLLKDAIEKVQPPPPPPPKRKPIPSLGVAKWLQLDRKLKELHKSADSYFPLTPPILKMVGTQLNSIKGEGDEVEDVSNKNTEEYKRQYAEYEQLEKQLQSIQESLTQKHEIRRKLAQSRHESELELAQKKKDTSSRVEHYRKAVNDAAAAQAQHLKEQQQEKEASLRRERARIIKEIEATDKRIQSLQAVPQQVRMESRLSEQVTIPSYVLPGSLGDWEPLGVIKVSATPGEEVEAKYLPFRL